MKKLLALFALALVLFAGCAQYGPGPGTNQTPNTTPGGSSGGKSVEISGFAFGPATLTIAKGTTVTWTNKDGAPHTITSDDGSSFASGQIAQGGTFSNTFNTPGTYAYHCSIHPSMHGTIVVQ